MIKKAFILTQFGTPHEWSNQFFQNVSKLGSSGWDWLIFTPNVFENVPENVKIIHMTIETFNRLIQEKLGVNPENKLINGVPSKNVSDFYVASGVIFEDYLKGYDFWGMTNWDIVYGRLSQFVPDELLQASDIFSDDINTINGIFCLFRNNEKINNLFRLIPNWETNFTTHKLYGLDEYDLTKVVRALTDITFMTPKYYPLHGHDRLETQQPTPKLSMKEDSSLWELSEDIGHPKWEHARPFIGREIPYYHFIRSKKWPKFVS